MEDKRTRSDYIREIQRLERVNKYFEKSNKELIRWLESEIKDIENRINKSWDFLGDSNGNYTLRMYLTQQKNTLIKVSKKLDELSRD